MIVVILDDCRSAQIFKILPLKMILQVYKQPFFMRQWQDFILVTLFAGVASVKIHSGVTFYWIRASTLAVYNIPPLLNCYFNMINRRQRENISFFSIFILKTTFNLWEKMCESQWGGGEPKHRYHSFHSIQSYLKCIQIGISGVDLFKTFQLVLL